MDQISSLFTRQPSLFQRAFRWAKTPIFISFLVIPVRFILELMGVPEHYIFIIGLLWLTLVISIYWGVKMVKETKGVGLLLVSLLLFAPISRIPVFIVWWIDKQWELNTHYGLFFEHWLEALLNQVGYGALVQIIPGFVLGWLTLTIMKVKTKKESIKTL